MKVTESNAVTANRNLKVPNLRFGKLERITCCFWYAFPLGIFSTINP